MSDEEVRSRLGYRDWVRVRRLVDRARFVE